MKNETECHVNLETYIVFPFQIAKESHTGEFGADDFRKHLVDSECWTKGGVHDPDWISATGLDECDLKRIRYQAYNYFHPFVRSFWYDSNPVQRFRHRKLKKLKTSFYGLNSPVEFDACADLYHFLPDIGILVLHLKAVKPLLLQEAQECLDRLRRIYPPYIGKDGVYGGHFPDSVELLDESGLIIGAYNNDQITTLIYQASECEKKQTCDAPNDLANHGLAAHGHVFANHWAALLEPLGQEGVYHALQLGDDRAALVSKVDLFPAEETPVIEWIDRGNMIRLCFADAKGKDRLPYAEPYMEQFEKRFCYDRFWYLNGESSESPSRVMNCGYAFTWLGKGEDKEFFTNPFDGAPVAFRHIYLPMAIIAHFQKAALLVASRRLADLSPYLSNGTPGELKENDFKQVEAHFLAFTQTFWFEEITPQEQGVELFDMWQRELKIKASYQELRQELQDIVAFINGREEKKQSDAALLLNGYAARFAIVGLVLTYISMLAGVLGVNAFGIDALVGFDSLMKGLGFVSLIILFGCSFPVILAPIALYLFPQKSKQLLIKTVDRIKGKMNV